MSNLRELYQNVILEHNRSPRNYRVLENADRTAQGNNPLCGDQVRVWLRMDGDVIKEATFQGSGCAISRASASLMTGAVVGKTRAEADALFERSAVAFAASAVCTDALVRPSAVAVSELHWVGTTVLPV